MGATIVIVVAAVIIAAVFTMLIILRINTARAAKGSREKKSQPKQAPPAWADAVVVEAQSGPTENNEQMRVALTLEVSPPEGATFLASAVWLVDTGAMHLAAPGCHVPVKLAGRHNAAPAAAWASPTVRCS